MRRFPVFIFCPRLYFNGDNIYGGQACSEKERHSAKPHERQIYFCSWFLLAFPVIQYLLVVSKSVYLSCLWTDDHIIG